MALTFKELPPTLRNVIFASCATEIPTDVWITQLVLGRWNEVWEEGEFVGLASLDKMGFVQDVIPLRRAQDVSRTRTGGEAPTGVVLPDKPPTLRERFKRMVAKLGRPNHAEELPTPAGSNGMGGGDSNPVSVDVCE